MQNSRLLALQALSSDLLRVAVGRYQGDKDTAATFTKEALARIEEAGEFLYKDKILISLASAQERSAEDLLMYSTLIEHYSHTQK